MRAVLGLLAAGSLLASTCFGAEGPSGPEKQVLSRGSALEQRGEYRRAKAVYLAGLREFPRSGELSFRIGTIYLREGNWPQAIASLEQAAQSRPTHVDTLYYLAQAYYLDGQHGVARERLLRALAFAPRRADVTQKYGEYLCEDKQCQQGLPYLLKAQRLDPSLRDIEFDIGMAYHRQAAIPEAQRHLEIALKSDPGNLVAARFLADILGRQQQWDQARDLYRRVLAREPNNAWALYGLGRSLLALDDAQGAIGPLRHALAADPTIAEAHFQLGRAFRQLGRRDEEERELSTFKAMRAHSPGSPSGVNSDRTPAETRMWDECRRLLREGSESDALAYLDSVLTGDAQDSHYLLGVLYLSLGRNTDAVRMLAGVAARYPEDPDILAFLGRAYVAAGNLEAAEATLARARALRPDGELVLIGAGELELARKRPDQAILYLEESKTSQVPALLKLCRAYVLTNDRAKALETAELVRAFGKDDPASLRELDSILASGSDPAKDRGPHR
jgi:tetratricopeptide (TPR) repeat protein